MLAYQKCSINVVLAWKRVESSETQGEDREGPGRKRVRSRRLAETTQGLRNTSGEQ